MSLESDSQVGVGSETSSVILVVLMNYSGLNNGKKITYNVKAFNIILFEHALKAGPKIGVVTLLRDGFID